MAREILLFCENKFEVDKNGGYLIWIFKKRYILILTFMTPLGNSQITLTFNFLSIEVQHKKIAFSMNEEAHYECIII